MCGTETFVESTDKYSLAVKYEVDHRSWFIGFGPAPEYWIVCEGDRPEMAELVSACGTFAMPEIMASVLYSVWLSVKGTTAPAPLSHQY